eukprot:maker-scaffold1846_size26495-snap-gene-0.4 protein:Tk03903 transcript:maker-scaffold1846_size26495-snap-gene-0.4-mRNA-1 annotation:"c-5 sterol desaturase erg31-like"
MSDLKSLLIKEITIQSLPSSIQESTRPRLGSDTGAQVSVLLCTLFTASPYKVTLVLPAATADWIIFLTCFWKSLEQDSRQNVLVHGMTSQDDLNGLSDGTILTQSYLSRRFANLGSFMVPSFIVSYLFYFGIGGFLHFWYYVRQREMASEWKCQPNHFLSTRLELHEILVGVFSLTIGAFISSCIACWVMNDGFSMIYFGVSDYGWFWFFLQWPIIFVMQDYMTYWIHRIYHMPFLYKHFHKLHHTYKHPTAFSVTAIHPFEFISIQLIYILPMFVLPVHWVPYSTILIYTYYHGIIDHSGINFKRQWWQPWQPDCIFHDNHHQYFHVNFGFNIEYWDKLHGTYRRKDRLYTEDIFWGTGKTLAESSSMELEADLAERNSENPKAYRNNEMTFKLTEQDKGLWSSSVAFLKSFIKRETSKMDKDKIVGPPSDFGAV